MVEAFGLFKKFLPLASFGGAPYSADETGVVDRVVKAGCVVGARMHVAGKMSVNLSRVDRCAMNPPETTVFSGVIYSTFDVSLRSPAWKL